MLVICITYCTHQNKSSILKKLSYSITMHIGHILLSLPLMSLQLTTCMIEMIHILQYNLTQCVEEAGIVNINLT